MTDDPVKVSKETPLEVAWKMILDHSFRQMPVCDGDRVVGIVNRTDLLRSDPSLAKDLDSQASPTVGDVMTHDPVVIGANEPIERAVSRMHEKKIGALPVVDADKLVGILTRTDVFLLFSQLFGLDDSRRQEKFRGEGFTESLEKARERASESQPVSFVTFRRPGDSEWLSSISFPEA